MATRRTSEPEETPRRRRPATTPEGRENQLIAMATDLAEKRIREGTASAQEIVHYLKLGSSRERLEQARLEAEVALQMAKVEQLQSVRNVESLIEDAIAAMKSYRGETIETFDD